MEATSTEPDHAGDPVAVEGRWYRGNLHAHSTNSMDVPEDRGKSPADVVAWYPDHGYDFVGITDHRFLTDTSAFATAEFLTINRIETHNGDARGRTAGRPLTPGLPTSRKSWRLVGAAPVPTCGRFLASAPSPRPSSGDVGRCRAMSGDVGRFRSKAAFATAYAVAPLPASSGHVQRHRPNRQLNPALHTIALVGLGSNPTPSPSTSLQR